MLSIIVECYHTQFKVRLLHHLFVQAVIYNPFLVNSIDNYNPTEKGSRYLLYKKNFAIKIDRSLNLSSDCTKKF